MLGRDDFRAGVERWAMGQWEGVQDHNLLQTVWVDDMRDAWARDEDKSSKQRSSADGNTVQPRVCTRNSGRVVGIPGYILHTVMPRKSSLSDAFP